MDDIKVCTWQVHNTSVLNIHAFRKGLALFCQALFMWGWSVFKVFRKQPCFFPVPCWHFLGRQPHSSDPLKVNKELQFVFCVHFDKCPDCGLGKLFMALLLLQVVNQFKLFEEQRGENFAKQPWTCQQLCLWRFLQSDLLSTNSWSHLITPAPEHCAHEELSSCLSDETVVFSSAHRWIDCSFVH